METRDDTANDAMLTEEAYTDHVQQNSKRDQCDKNHNDNYGQTLCGCVSNKTRCNKNRLVLKTGCYNISCTRCSDVRGGRCAPKAGDLFTMLIDAKWRYNLLMFASVFIVSWIGFALVWWGIAVVHGDVEHAGDGNWSACLSQVVDFPSALFYSIDLQSTMGYGGTEIQSHCPGAILLFMFQCCLGLLLECLAAGVVFAKMIRPKRRRRTVLFSRNAVVRRERFPKDRLVLEFRMADMRRSTLITASVLAVVVRLNQRTTEGELLPIWTKALELTTETGTTQDSEDESNSSEVSFLVGPETVIHVLGKTSPLETLTEEMLRSPDAAFEIVVVLEATDDSTGLTTQIRTSYLPSEILWAHKLAPLSIRHLANETCSIDYSQFHFVLPDPI